jgi:hypothetical protein
MAKTWRGAAIATLVLVFAAGGFAVPASPVGCGVAFAGDEPEKPKKSVDAADVYFGDARKWDKPAEVDADQVYAKIDEYKEILDKGLKPDDPKYEILMSKASKRFACAVKKAAKDGGYDLVARIGAVKGVDSVPDITSDAIAKL